MTKISTVHLLCLLVAIHLGIPAIPAEPEAKEKVLILGNTAEPRSLDPNLISAVYEFNIVRALFEGLVIPHPSKDEVNLPGVANRWESDGEGTKWTFYLRKDAKWSDGEAVTAEDFIFSYERLLTPEVGASYSFMLYHLNGAEAFHKGKIKDFAKVGVKALDRHTLEFTLNKRTPFFPRLLTHHTWYPIPKHHVERLGGKRDRFSPWASPRNIMGNGSFAIGSWKEGEHLGVVKNPHYWDADHVDLDGIRFLPIGNAIEEEEIFHAGEIHVTYTVAPERIGEIRKNHREVYRNEPYYGTYFVRCNTERKPLDNPKVRLALSFALDSKKIIKEVTRGAQWPATGLVPPSDSYPGIAAVEFDPARGRKLLEEAGYPRGDGFPAITLLTTDRESAIRMAETLRLMWKEHLGIDVRSVRLEWTKYLQSMLDRRYDLGIGGWIADYLDPTTFLDMWVRDGNNNRTGWASERYEGLLEEAMRATRERYALLRDAEALLLAERPILPIYWYTRNYLVRPEVKGWHPLIMDDRPYKFVRLSD